MADEISQVVEMEYKGVFYLIKGTKEAITALISGIKAIADWSHQKSIKKPGESSWSKIQEASDGNALIVEIPIEMFEKTETDKWGRAISPFEKYMKENKLRYCSMPDFNPYDDYVPVGIVSQDYAIHQAHIKEYMNMRINHQKENDQNYDEKIEDAMQRYTNARTDEEKAQIESEMKELEQAKAENKKLLEESENKLSKGNKLAFEEYMKSCEGTKFEENPQKALAEAECLSNGQEVPIGKDFMPEECMYPIRNKESVPKSKEFYYTQTAADHTLYTIRREFTEDDHGLIFSNYYVTNAKNAGEVRMFSDKGLSNEEWKAQLPELLKNSGMVATAPTRAIDSEKRLESYIRYMDVNFKKASENEAENKANNQAEASSEESEKFVEKVKSSSKQKASYNRSKFTTFLVPNTTVMGSVEGIPSVELEKGLLVGVSIGEDNGHGECPVTIKSNKEYLVEMPDGTKDKMKGSEAIQMLRDNKAGAETKARSHHTARK